MPKVDIHPVNKQGIHRALNRVLNFELKPGQAVGTSYCFLTKDLKKSYSVKITLTERNETLQEFIQV